MTNWNKTGNMNETNTATGDMPEIATQEYTTADLWQEAWSKAGKSLFYMEFIRPEIYLVTDPRKLSGRKQLVKVKQMCYYLAREWNSHFKDTQGNRDWFRKWIEEFDNETENMC